jgi:subtilisin family serine protease
MAKKVKSGGRSRVKHAKKGTLRKAAAPKKSPARKASRPSGTDKYAFASQGPVFQAPRDTLFPAQSALAEGLLPLSPTSPDSFKTRLSPVSGQSASQLKRLALSLPGGMDPRLQLAVANFRTGKTGPTLASTADDEVAVVARVDSVEEWEAIPDVDPGIVMGMMENGKEWIVTGRFQIDRIEAVLSNKHVFGLSAPQFIQASLDATVEAMETGDGALPKGTRPNGGYGTVVGIVDFGCDFVHENFCNSNGKTRLLALWQQSGGTRRTGGVKYGTVYSRKVIDAALGKPNPYAALGYAPRNEKGGTHGTHVMDIAAGNGNGTGLPGVAAKADIIFVDVAISDIAWQGKETVDTHFGDSIQLLEAVRFVFDTAGDRPCVCNISLGLYGGPHDGTSFVEQGLDAIVRERPNRAIVVAAGNAQALNIHTSATVSKQTPVRLGWRQLNEGGGEFELWYPGALRLEVTLVSPDGTKFGPVRAGDNLTYTATTGEVVIFIGTRLNDPGNGDNMIGIWLAEGLSNGDFIVELTTEDDEEVECHAWLEPHTAPSKQSRFVNPVLTHSLASISNGRETIVVGSFDGHKSRFPISSFSSAGPTRDGRQKPELSAPGQFVHAAMSGSQNKLTKKSGTSMAAPAVTGLIALIYAEAQRKGKDLSIKALRKQLLDCVSVAPPHTAQPKGWDPVYGFGRANGRSIKVQP